ncbi:MAG: 50S ribosomal protein L18 [Candidatus Dojkabacteria bacterium]|jgi:large subunit ribosomal protein L18
MKKNKAEKRERRKMHIRKNLVGSSDKPRVFVFKSNRYFYSGVADDEKGVVLMGERAERRREGIVEMSKKFASDLKKKKIKEVVFDRSGYRYHGLIALFVEELKKNGIKI